VLKPFVVAATLLLAQAVGSRSAVATAGSTNGVTSQPKILIEGANALLLDIDHGTYPFV